MPEEAPRRQAAAAAAAAAKVINSIAIDLIKLSKPGRIGEVPKSIAAGSEFPEGARAAPPPGSPPEPASPCGKEPEVSALI